MNPLRIRARSYRTFETLELTLPTGCAAIVGPNGAGKSSLVNLVDLALFGPDGRSWAPYLTQGGESSELEIELEFEHAGQIYRARRGYSSRGSGKSTLDLERRDTDEWVPATLEGQRATQAHVEEILGLSRDTFRASAFLAQGDGAAWTEATPARRKEVLAKILGLNRFRAPLDAVRADRREAEGRVEALSGMLQRADAELAERETIDGVLVKLRADTAEAERARDGAGAAADETARRVTDLEAARTARAELQTALMRADADLRPLEAAATAAAQARETLTTVEAELEAVVLADRDEIAATIAQAKQALAEHDAGVARREEIRRDAATKAAQITAIQAQASAKAAEIKRLDAQVAEVEADELAHCPTCEQALGADAKAATLGSLNARATVLDYDRDVLLEQAAAITVPEIPAAPEPPLEAQQTLADALTAQARRADAELNRDRLAAQVDQLRATVASAPSEQALADAVTARDAARAAVDQVQQITAEMLAAARDEAQAARLAAQMAASRVETCKTDEAHIAANAERLAELAKASAADRFDREREQRKIDRLTILERAFGRDGIPALIVQGSAIPAIETEADRILDEFGTSYRVELRTEKALADGGSADALDLVVTTDRGERPYETFSGGERTRLNLALRIALARLLASRRGAESRVLAIDEPEFLDDAGTAALARVLHGLNGSFDKVWLVSHVPDLRGAFDQTIEVVKGDDGRSRIAA